MWPWSKFDKYEQQIGELLCRIEELNRENQVLHGKLHRITDRDSRGRFKK